MGLLFRERRREDLKESRAGRRGGAVAVPRARPVFLP